MSLPFYRATREIAAPAEAVWAVLGDLDRYAEWNPFTPYVETSREVGQPIVLYVDFGLHWPPLERGKLLRQVETIYRFEPGDALCWTAKLLHPQLHRYLMQRLQMQLTRLPVHQEQLIQSPIRRLQPAPGQNHRLPQGR